MIKEAFVIGFKTRMEKLATGSIGSAILKELPGLAGSSLGFSLGSNLYENIAKNKSLSGWKVADEALNNMLIFGALTGALHGGSALVKKIIGLGGRALGAAKGAVAPAAEALSRAAKSPGVISKKQTLKELLSGAKEMSISKAKQLGQGAKSLLEKTKDIAKDEKKRSKLLSLLSSPAAIGAGAGSILEYDPDAPISSIVSGAGKGGALGHLLYGPHMGKFDPTTAKGALGEGLRSGVAISAGMGAMERKHEREQEKQIREYYRKLQELQRRRQQNYSEY